MTRTQLAPRLTSRSAQERSVEADGRCRRRLAAVTVALLGIAAVLASAGAVAAEERVVRVTFVAADQPIWPASDPPDGRTLIFDQAWDESDSVSEKTELDTFMGTYEFGVEANGSTSGRFRLWGDRSGFATGEVDIVFPAQVSLSYPDPLSFRAGAWVEIGTQLTALPGWAMNISGQGEGVVTIEGDIQISAEFEPSLCFFGCESWDLPSVDTPTLSMPLFHVDKRYATVDFPCPVDGCAVGVHRLVPHDIDPKVADYTGLSGRLDFPRFELSPVRMEGGMLVVETETDTDPVSHEEVVPPFVNLKERLTEFLKYNAVPAAAETPDQLKPAYGAYALLQYMMEITGTQRQRFEFAPSVGVRFSLSRSVPWHVVNATGSVTGSGTGATILVPAGSRLRLRTPSDESAPIGVTSAIVMAATFSNATQHEYEKDLYAEAGKLELHVPKGKTFDGFFEWIASICDDWGCCGRVAGACVCWYPDPYSCNVPIPVPPTYSPAFDVSLGPLWKETIDKRVVVDEITRATWPLPELPEKSGPAFTIAPEPLGTLTVAVSDASAGTVTGTGLACPGDCQRAYYDLMYIQPNARPGWVFGFWQGDAAGSAVPLAVPIASGASKTISAVFARDTDADGVADDLDNCPTVPNANQSDVDGDAVGDAGDNCPRTVNADQADADGDTLGDVCDNCPVNCDPMFGTVEESLGTGRAVDVDGDVAVVSRKAAGVDVYIRGRNGSPGWHLVKTITVPAGGPSYRRNGFGHSVAVAGDLVAVGSMHQVAGYVGEAFVFARNRGGADNWGLVRTIDGASQGLTGDSRFGSSVALESDNLLVGAPLGWSGDHDSPTGAAFLFKRNRGGADSWGQLMSVAGSDGVALGTSVAIAGGNLAIGGSWRTMSTWYGEVRVYRRQAGTPESWALVRTIPKSEFTTATTNWMEMAADLDLDGDFLVVGSPLDRKPSSRYSGSVRVFQRNRGGADAWGLVGARSPSDAADDDEFGRSVAIAGNIILVGAPGDDDRGADSGSLYAFVRNHGGSNAWAEVEQLGAANGAAGDRMGDYCAFDGDTIVASAGEAERAYAFDLLAARDDAVFLDEDAGGADLDVLANDPAWMPRLVANRTSPTPAGVVTLSQGLGQTIHAVPVPNAEGIASFSYSVKLGPVVARATESEYDSSAGVGSAVALDGHLMVVGAPSIYSSGTRGHAYIVVGESGGVRTITGLAGRAGGNQFFGAAVAIAGDIVVVGEPGDPGAEGTGHAYVHQQNQGGADAWGRVRDLAGGRAFGTAVGLVAGNYLVSTSPYAGTNGRGEAYLYHRNSPGADAWGNVATLVASDAADYDHFGAATAADGDVIVIGATQLDAVNGRHGNGAAYVLMPGGGAWSQVAKLVATDGAADDAFGAAVAVRGDTIVVGAPGATGGRGAAYVFLRNAGGADAWGFVRKLVGSDSVSGDRFGSTIAIDAGYVAVGVEHADGAAGNDQGAVYLFARNSGGSDAWGQVAKLVAPDAAASDAFGSAVALSGPILVAGAKGDDPVGVTNSGSALLWDLREGAASVTVNVVPFNDPPTISALTDRTTPEDVPAGPISFTVGDVETPAASLILVASSSDEAVIPSGRVLFGGAGTARTVTVVPAANQSGAAAITVTVSDGAKTAGRTFNVVVSAVNDEPSVSAIGDVVIAEDGATGPIAFTVGDVETADPSTLVVTAFVGDPGLVPSVVVGGAGASRTVALTPADDAFGSTVVIVRVSDGLATAEGTFDLTVNPVNDVPTITTLVDPTIDEDGSTGPLAFAVGDVETDPGELVVTATAADGALLPPEGIALTGDGAARTLDLTPAADASGAVVVTVTVSDRSDSASAPFTLTVRPVNDPPDAVDDGEPSTWRTFEEVPFTTPSALANDTDPDPGDTLAMVSVDTTGTMGLVASNGDGSFFYDPNGAFDGLEPGTTGTDRFTYTLGDGHGGSDTATVTIAIEGRNHAPAALDDAGAAFTTTEHEPLTLAVLANDTDPDPGDALRIDSFDDSGTTGVVSHEVELQLHAAVRQLDDSGGLLAANGLGVTYGDTIVGTLRYAGTRPDWTAPPGGPTTIAEYTSEGPEHGLELTVPAPTGSVVAFAAGTLGVQVGDGVEMGSFSASADYLAVRTAAGPLAVGQARASVQLLDATGTALGSTALPLTAPALAAFGSDAAVSLTLEDGSGGTSFVDAGLTSLISVAPTALAYDPRGRFDHLHAGEVAIDTFTYVAADVHGGTAQATVRVTVVGMNDPPAPVADSYSGLEDVPITIAAPGVLGNDTDPENDPLIASLLAAPAHGVLSLAADGSFVYTPSPGFNGVDSLVYLASDGALSSPFGAAVQLQVGAVDDAPHLVRDTGVTIPDCGSVTLTSSMLQAADADTAGDSLQFVLSELPSDGMLEVSGYRPGLGEGFTQADVDRGRVAYIHSCTLLPAGDRFAFSVTDGTSGDGPAAFLIGVDTALGDSDGDGVPNVVEDAAPNGGDADGDGTLDRRQGTVASLPAGTSGGYVTLVISGCGGLRSVTLPGTVPAAGPLTVAFVCAVVPCGAATLETIVHGVRSTQALAPWVLRGVPPAWQRIYDCTGADRWVAGQEVAAMSMPLADGCAADCGAGGDGRVELTVAVGFQEGHPVPFLSLAGMALLIAVLALGALAILRRAG